MKKSVFISYTTKDQKLAFQLCDFLEKNNYKVNICPRDIPAGKNYAEYIPITIRQSNIFIVLVSNQTYYSNNVESEIHFAFDDKKKIIPIKLDDSELTEIFEYYLQGAQWITTKPRYFEKCFDMVIKNLQDNNTSFGYSRQKRFADNIFKIGVSVVLFVEFLVALYVFMPRLQTWVKTVVDSSSVIKDKSVEPPVEMTTEISLTTKQNTYVTCKSYENNHIMVYDSPESTKIKGYIPEGKMCSLISEVEYDGDTYGKIDYCGVTGWTEMDNLRFFSSDDHSFTLDDNSEHIIYINANGGVSLHDEPCSTSEIIFTDVEYGTELAITSLQEGWGETEYKGKTVWIDMLYTSFYSSKYYMVERKDGQGDSIKLRSDPSEDSKELGHVSNGTILQCHEYKNGWGRFYVDGKNVWIKLYYMTSCPKNGFKNDEQ